MDSDDNRTVSEFEFRLLVEEVRKLTAAWEEHVELYGEFLKEALQEKKDKAELRKIILHKITEGGVWATVIFLAIASWDYIKAHIK